MPSVYLTPYGNGTYTEWNVYPTSPMQPYWGYVDDPPGTPDDDGTYHWETIEKLSEVICTYDSVLDGATIENVRVWGRARLTQEPMVTNHIELGLRIGGVRYPASMQETLSTKYKDCFRDWPENPATGEPWQPSDLFAGEIEISVRHLGITESFEVRLTQVYLEVTYTPAPKGWINKFNRGSLLPGFS